jgi:hypothetical protein
MDNVQVQQQEIPPVILAAFLAQIANLDETTFQQVVNTAIDTNIRVTRDPKSTGRLKNMLLPIIGGAASPGGLII